MILLLVLPEDFENFCQSCKSVYKQASRDRGDEGRSLLKEHRRLMRKYRVLTGDLEAVGPFLRAVAADQRIVRYVRKMDLGPTRRSVNVSRWGLEDLFENRNLYELLLSAAKRIHEDVSLVERVKEYKPQEQMKQTIRLVCANTELAMALILPLLPNLSALSLRWRLEGNSEKWTQFWVRNLASRPIPMLKKLKEPNSRSEIQSRGYTMVDVVRLTGIHLPQQPSVWYWESGSLSSADRPWAQLNLRPTITNRNLKLRGGQIDAWVLRDYLESFDKLTSLCLLDVARTGQVFDPMPPFAALLSHSKCTLTKLTLRSITGSTTAKPPFTELEALKELYVDWEMLLPQPYAAGWNWKHILPQSLETLTIHDNYDTLEDWNTEFIWNRFEPVVEDVIACKVGELPRIRDFSFTARHDLHSTGWYPHVILSEFSTLERNFYRRCQAVDVRFSFTSPEQRKERGCVGHL